MLLPVGSTEQHGPHLPLATDAMIAHAVAARAAGQLLGEGRAVRVAPTLAYGASGEHQDFAGTLSIGTEVLQLVLVELGRSACTWAEGVVLVNGHGGNARAVLGAVAQLRSEGRAVTWTSCDLPGADAHAGRTETSLLQHLAPWAVRTDLAEPGNTDPVESLMPRLRAEGVRAVSANGVLGDPTASTPELGRSLLEALVGQLVAELRLLEPGPGGRLNRVVEEGVTGPGSGPATGPAPRPATGPATTLAPATGSVAPGPVAPEPA
ncbi:MAG: creatininase family protein, partial [Marmoricola sp.]|nr:creatininase family protein [Marmoricola sp.]